jgi:hypothetical protein
MILLAYRHGLRAAELVDRPGGKLLNMQQYPPGPPIMLGNMCEVYVLGSRCTALIHGADIMCTRSNNPRPSPSCHWDGLTRVLDDGRIEFDTKNALFAGYDDGAENWAILASLIETAKLSNIGPQAWLADILTRLVNLWPNNRLDEMLPWNWAAARQQQQRAA